MVIVDPYDIAFFELGDDGRGKTLVYSDILFVRGRFVKVFGLGSIWYGIVQTRPEDLMAKLVVAALKLGIGDPNGQTVALVQHALIDVVPEVLGIGISAGAQGAHPKLLLHPLADAVYGVLQATVAVGVGLHVPWLVYGDSDSIVDGGGSAGERAAFPAETGEGLVWVCCAMTSGFDGRRRLAIESKPGELEERVGDFVCRRECRGGEPAL